MAQAQVVYTNISNGVLVNGTLFQDTKFWLSRSVPLRNTICDQIKSNGGTVVELEQYADIKIVDHAKKNAPAGTYSFRYITESIRHGRLENLEDHLVGPRQGTRRNVGASNSTKGSRTPFTAEDDVVLYRWVKDQERQGARVLGNEIYRQLEEINPRHTYQSWRDRWVKILSSRPEPKLPRVGGGGEGASSSIALERRVDGKGEYPNRKDHQVEDSAEGVSRGEGSSTAVSRSLKRRHDSDEAPRTSLSGLREKRRRYDADEAPRTNLAVSGQKRRHDAEYGLRASLSGSPETRRSVEAADQETRVRLATGGSTRKRGRADHDAVVEETQAHSAAAAAATIATSPKVSPGKRRLLKVVVATKEDSIVKREEYQVVGEEDENAAASSQGKRPVAAVPAATLEQGRREKEKGDDERIRRVENAPPTTLRTSPSKGGDHRHHHIPTRLVVEPVSSSTKRQASQSDHLLGTPLISSGDEDNNSNNENNHEELPETEKGERQAPIVFNDNDDDDQDLTSEDLHLLSTLRVPSPPALIIPPNTTSTITPLDIQSFITTHLPHHSEPVILWALKRTNMDPSLARLLLSSLPLPSPPSNNNNNDDNHQPPHEIPPALRHTPGIWTEEDDHILLHGQDARRIEALQGKHGDGRFLERVAFWVEWG